MSTITRRDAPIRKTPILHRGSTRPLATTNQTNPVRAMFLMPPKRFWNDATCDST